MNQAELEAAMTFSSVSVVCSSSRLHLELMHQSPESVVSPWLPWLACRLTLCGL